MSESDRRFQRYTLAPKAFSSQRVKGTSFLSLLRGWNDCRVKDMSTAGALILAKVGFDLGDEIEVELVTIEGQKMRFHGEVVNLGKDHQTDDNKLGIKIDTPRPSSTEADFLSALPEKFQPSR